MKAFSLLPCYSKWMCEVVTSWRGGTILLSTMQAMQTALEAAPTDVSPQDTASNWHALRALPSAVDSARQHLHQQAALLQADRQSLVLAAADAKAELTSRLDQVQAQPGAEGTTTRALQSCLQSAHAELQVGVH